MKLGLVGLMLACLLAAMMSSADTYMIVTSALVVRNVYAPYINSDAGEKKVCTSWKADRFWSSLLVLLSLP